MRKESLSLAKVEQARNLFFVQGCAPAPWLAPHISRSWERCRSLCQELVDAQPMAPAQLSDRRERVEPVLSCVQPEMDGLAQHVLGADRVAILSDANGLILETIGNPQALPTTARAALQPGMEWSEALRGTNAIGTALAEGEALMVRGGEHYLSQNGALGCAAAPIFSGRGELAGVLDISGEAARIDSRTLGLACLAAQQVEHRMMLTQACSHLLRFHTKPTLIGSPREGLMLIADGRIAAINRTALALLGCSWAHLLGLNADDFLGSNWLSKERQRSLLTLLNGQQVAAVMERAPLSGQPRFAQRCKADSCDSRKAEIDDMQPHLTRAVRVLNEGVPVLINGETGSGKEVFSRRLHEASRRKAGPFVAVDCASLPEALIESELFGYEAGAFTGASRKGMKGRIREAHGGILFLDEIAELPLSLQTRLLRVLEERVVAPLGGGRSVAVDFDLICATHGQLAARVQAGQFRADLMYRVAGFIVHLPPLRERGDRRFLISRLFQQIGAAKRLRLDEEALDVLVSYPWPGNVRELLSILRTTVALADPDDRVTPGSLPAHLRSDGSTSRQAQAEPSASNEPAMPLKVRTRQAIADALKASAYDVAQAARQLGVHRSTVYRHLARLRGAS